MLAALKSLKPIQQAYRAMASSFVHDIETASEYHKIASQFSKAPYAVLFYTSYGKPSLTLKKKLEAKADQYKKSVISVDVELAPEICEEFHVESVPTLFTLNGESVKDTFVGLPNDDKINDMIKAI